MTVMLSNTISILSIFTQIDIRLYPDFNASSVMIPPFISSQQMTYEDELNQLFREYWDSSMTTSAANKPPLTLPQTQLVWTTTEGITAAPPDATEQQLMISLLNITNVTTMVWNQTPVPFRNDNINITMPSSSTINHDFLRRQKQRRRNMMIMIGDDDRDDDSNDKASMGHNAAATKTTRDNHTKFERKNRRVQQPNERDDASYGLVTTIAIRGYFVVNMTYSELSSVTESESSSSSEATYMNDSNEPWNQSTVMMMIKDQYSQILYHQIEYILQTYSTQLLQHWNDTTHYDPLFALIKYIEVIPKEEDSNSTNHNDDIFANEGNHNTSHDTTTNATLSRWEWLGVVIGSFVFVNLLIILIFFQVQRGNCYSLDNAINMDDLPDLKKGTQTKQQLDYSLSSSFSHDNDSDADVANDPNYHQGYYLSSSARKQQQHQNKKQQRSLPESHSTFPEEISISTYDSVWDTIVTETTALQKQNGSNNNQHETTNSSMHHHNGYHYSNSLPDTEDRANSSEEGHIEFYNMNPQNSFSHRSLFRSNHKVHNNRSLSTISGSQSDVLHISEITIRFDADDNVEASDDGIDHVPTSSTISLPDHHHQMSPEFRNDDIGITDENAEHHDREKYEELMELEVGVSFEDRRLRRVQRRVDNNDGYYTTSSQTDTTGYRPKTIFVQHEGILGIVLIMTIEGPLIQTIHPDSPVKDLFQTGDLILAVNGCDMKHEFLSVKNLCQLPMSLTNFFEAIQDSPRQFTVVQMDDDDMSFMNEDLIFDDEANPINSKIFI